MGRRTKIYFRKAGYDDELCTELVHDCAKWRGFILVTWNFQIQLSQIKLTRLRLLPSTHCLMSLIIN
jgi:hypothetical protein